MGTAASPASYDRVTSIPGPTDRRGLFLGPTGASFGRPPLDRRARRAGAGVGRDRPEPGGGESRSGRRGGR